MRKFKLTVSYKCSTIEVGKIIKADTFTIVDGQYLFYNDEKLSASFRVTDICAVEEM